MNIHDGMDKMNKIIKELGLEEEFARLASELQNQFMIMGEETEDLAEALGRADDTLIDMIWEEIEQEEPVTREEKEKILLKDIPEVFESEMVYMSPEELGALVKTMACQELSSEELMILTSGLSKKGYVFIFSKNGMCVPVVMKQIADIARNKLKEQETQLEIGFVQAIRIMLRAALNLYGVFDRHQIKQMFQLIKTGEESETDVWWKQWEKNIDIVIRELEKRENRYWIDGEYVVDYMLEDKKAYKALLRKREGKGYYMPSSIDEAEAWSRGIADRENVNYKGMLSILTKSLNNKSRAEDIMAELASMVVMEGCRLANIMNHLYMIGIEFDNEVAGRNFTIHCVKWLHTVKRWSNAGYSNEELGLPNADEGKEWGGILQEKPAKIQRNDPCPCGSGKKYKKCCMRKE